MGGSLDLNKKLLEMELRRELEGKGYEAMVIDALMLDILPFVLRKIQPQGPE
jgi:hypothetical protein